MVGFDWLVGVQSVRGSGILLFSAMSGMSQESTQVGPYPL
jgi:hypothetical protein